MESPDGQNHIDSIRGTGRPGDKAQSRANIDSDRAELEKLFGDLLREAKGRSPEGPEGDRPPDIDGPPVDADSQAAVRRR